MGGKIVIISLPPTLPSFSQGIESVVEWSNEQIIGVV
jgi:hypothetical protein